MAKSDFARSQAPRWTKHGLLLSHDRHNTFARLTHARDPPTDVEESTIYSLIFPRTPTARDANARKLQGLRAERIRKVEKTEYLMQQKLGIQLRRIIRFSIRRTSRDRSSGSRWQYTMWLPTGFRGIHAKKKKRTRN